MVDYDINYKANNLNKILKGTSRIKKDTKKAVNNVSNLNKELNETSKSIQNISGHASNIGDKFDIAKEKLGAFSKLTETLPKAFGNLKKRTASFGSNFAAARKNGMGMFKSLAVGSDGFNKALGMSNILIPITSKALMTLAAAAWPILIITVAVLALVAAFKFLRFTIKRAFKINAGGIATKWTKSMGKFKDVMAKLKLAFDDFIRANAPFFKILAAGFGFVFKIIINSLKFSLIYLKVLTWISKVFWKIIKPVIFLGKALALLTNPFALLFKYGGKLKNVFISPFQTFRNILKGLKNDILELISLIPDWALPEKFEKLKANYNLEEQKNKVSGGGNSTNNNDNSSRSVTINTSREITRQSGDAVANIIAANIA